VYDYGAPPAYGVVYGPPTYPPGTSTVPPRQSAPRAQAAGVAAPAPGRNVVQNTTPPRPTAVRGVAEDEPARPRVTSVAMPSPDQLQVGAARPADSGIDWTATRGRLQDLGVVSFQVDQLPAGGFQFTCFLPTAEAGKTHRVEAHGATEAEAVRRALDEARRWRDQR
jgi:hypothetical protein